jgi:hypothetical protein
VGYCIGDSKPRYAIYPRPIAPLQGFYHPICGNPKVSTLVDEKTCEQDFEEPGIECVEVTNEWVTNTANLAPGILPLEVIVTDRAGLTAAERFWVNIPQTPPPPNGAPAPPTFNEVLQFREEFGLDLMLDIPFPILHFRNIHRPQRYSPAFP